MKFHQCLSSCRSVVVWRCSAAECRSISSPLPVEMMRSLTAALPILEKGWVISNSAISPERARFLRAAKLTRYNRRPLVAASRRGAAACGSALLRASSCIASMRKAFEIGAFSCIHTGNSRQPEQTKSGSSTIDDTSCVGGGHSGTGAAASAARLGPAPHSSRIAATRSGDVATPAIGGLGKGHLVRETDALDGLIGRIAAGGIQFRCSPPQGPGGARAAQPSRFASSMPRRHAAEIRREARA